MNHILCRAEKAAGFLLDLLYPPNIYCACCGDAIDPDMPYGLCGRCVQEICWLSEEPATAGEEDASHLYRRAYSCARYESGTKAMLRRFKYGGKPGLCAGLARLMLERIQAEGLRPDLVIPVPMYRPKERARGYNQAALLAKAVAEGLGVPSAPELLVRTRGTGAMSTLSAEERRLNLRDAFRIGGEAAVSEASAESGPLAGKTVLLIDDILTTGTTADECARVLLRAGAVWVDLLVFASGGSSAGEGASDPCKN